MALFHVLNKQTFDLHWAVAHVDHGWRAESAAEAKTLEALCRLHSIPFYLKTLDKQSCVGNLEEYCRHERQKFFKEICREQGYQAVLMAHQMNDQAETILKRIFEGASFIRAEGMRSPVVLDGLVVIRPWLQVLKDEILAYLSREEISYFDDATNRDPKYLRARMRTSVIPALTHEFGKNILPSLVHLGKEVEECRDYLEKRGIFNRKPLIDGPFGTWLVDRGLHPFELRQLLKGWAFSDKLSRASIDDLIRHYVAERGSASFPLQNGEVIVDRGRLFFLNAPLQPQQWKMEIMSKGLPTSGWESVFQGGASFLVPEGNIRLGTMDQLLDKKRKALYLKRLSSAAVPQFLRRNVPLAIDKEEEIYSPFFSPHQKLSRDSAASISMLYA